MVGENAVLLAINPPGTVDAYGDVATAGTASWTGRVPACLTRSRKVAAAMKTERGTGGEMTLIEADVLIIRRAHAAPVSELPGDQSRATTILVEDRRTDTPVTKRFRVVGVDNRAAGTIADGLRLTLADERSS